MVVSNFNGGSVALLKETSPTSGTYGSAVIIPVGGHPNDVQMADLNGDGLPDLIVADDTGQVTYRLQNSASPGTFLTAVSLPITNRGITVAAGDLNGDGLPDLAVDQLRRQWRLGPGDYLLPGSGHPGTFLTPATDHHRLR